MPDLRDPHSFPIPTNSEKLYKDETVPGLFLRITFTGKRTWTFYRLLQGKPTKVKIADADALSLDEARVEATLLNAQLMTNPLTLEQLFDNYFTNHVLLHNARHKDIRRAFELHWQDLAKMRVEEIATHHVQSWFTKLANISPSVANKELHRLRACINFAIEQDVIAPRKNPCRGVKALPDVERELYLKPAQMKRLEFEIGRIKESCTRDALRMLYLTYQRKSNVCAMEWSEISLENKLWVIPAKKAKARKAIQVALTERALAVLRDRWNARNDVFTSGNFEYTAVGSPYVFPAPFGKTGHIRNIDNAWRKVRDRAGLSEFVIHSFRHTGGAILGISGASAFVIQRALGHSSIRMAQRYTHLDNDSVRALVEEAQAALFGSR